MTPIDRFADYLHSLAGKALAQTPLLDPAGHPEHARRSFVESFRDDQGHRRSVDGPLLAFMLGLRPAISPSTDADVVLWSALGNAGADPWKFILPGEGPLIDWRAAGSIETATEMELASLHALWHHARLRADRSLSLRVSSATRWLVDHVQPDNATGHPWAVHVLALAAAEHRWPEADLYAQTLVHNAVLGGGVPDRFSACLLLDASRALGQRTR